MEQTEQKKRITRRLDLTALSKIKDDEERNAELQKMFDSLPDYLTNPNSKCVIVEEVIEEEVIEEEV